MSYQFNIIKHKIKSLHQVVMSMGPIIYDIITKADAIHIFADIHLSMLNGVIAHDK